MELKLRDYQEELKNKLREAFKIYKKVILLAPCGAGKTVIASSIIKDSINKNKNIWFIVHRRELQAQAEKTLEKYGIPKDKIKVFMVQTLANKLNKINEIPDMIIYDECQHATSKTYQRITDKFPNSYFVGLSATPCRLSGKPLGDIFEFIVSGITANTLIQRKFLADYEYYAPDFDLDFENVTIKNGDYEKEELNILMEKSTIYSNILETYKKLANNKKTIIYCHSIEYSKKIEKLFLDNGYSIKHFDGDTPKNDRDNIIEDFRNNKIQILTNVDLIGEGFDVPNCECVLLLRATKSLSLYIQQSTRCLRPNGDKKAIIIDCVGNIYEHGMPTMDRKWELTQSPQKYCNDNEDGTLKIKRCTNCLKVYDGKMPECPYCHFKNPLTKREIQNKKNIELKKIQEEELKKIEELKKQQRREQGMAKTFGELVKLAKERGYKNPTGWAYMILKGRKNGSKK